MPFAICFRTLRSRWKAGQPGPADAGVRTRVQSKNSLRDRRNEMMEGLTQRKQDNGAKTQLILRGFSQTEGIRIYAFEGIGDGRRADYTVEVDLALIPGYGIRIQDLPLLCRELLQQRVESSEIRALTLDEHEMR